MEVRPRSVDLAILIGDVHVGRRTDTFNVNILRQRFDILIRNLRFFRRIVQRARMSARETILVLLGDIVDGESIYATQRFEQELNIDEQIDIAFDELTRLVEKAKITRIYAVPGNHGRSRRDGTGNWDYMLYRLMKEKCSIPVEILPDAGGLVTIGNASVFVFHGYQIKSYQQIPWYGITRYVSRRYIYSPFDIAFLGHFHTLAKYEFNTIPIYLNGTMLTDDELSKKYALKSLPEFWALVFPIEKKRPIIEMPIPLYETFQ